MSGRVALCSKWSSCLRFRLSTVLLLVLLIATWIGMLVHDVRVQREAVSTVKALGGWVAYDWQRQNGYYFPEKKPWAPEWLVRFVGVDSFGVVVAVGFPKFSTEVDAAMPQIAKLGSLVELDVSVTNVTDVGLAKLKDLKMLKTLDCSDTNITDAGIAFLKDLPLLSHLRIGMTHVTDNGLNTLRQFGALSELSLCGSTTISDSGAAHLKRLTNLKTLNLVGTSLSESTVRHLKEANGALEIFY